jgi:hypothetical protein
MYYGVYQYVMSYDIRASAHTSVEVMLGLRGCEAKKVHVVEEYVELWLYMHTTEALYLDGVRHCKGMRDVVWMVQCASVVLARR